jgi:trimethylamine--corrinoid protein Co-methyltransferase
VADALPNIDIVGAMVQPSEVPVVVRDIRIIAEMLKCTRKPVRTWVHNATSARYILKMFEAVAGSSEALRTRPRGLLGFEPTSPLIMSRESLDTLRVWVETGQPVSIGPIVQSMGTGPVTLAGTLAQQDAEILAGLVVVQMLRPGVGTVYFCGSLTMDPRTGNAIFACPEQTLLMAGGAQLAHRHGLPAGMQLGLTDAKVPDAQAGMEKAMGLLMGGLAGMNLSSGLGIAGCDQGASLAQLVIDDEIVDLVRQVLGGLTVDEETCAFEAIARVGIGGNFLTDSHTLAHVHERWIPRLSDRGTWATWQEEGAKDMLERAWAEQTRILREHSPNWLDESIQKELDTIVVSAEREILDK